MRVRGLLCLALGAAASRAAYLALTARPPGGAATWTRTNHRGDSLTLLEGPAVAVSASVATAAVVPGRLRAAALLAGLGSGALGAYDDLVGSTDSRGFKGHLGALAHGQVTSGAVKILGIGATGLAAAALAHPYASGARTVLPAGARGRALRGAARTAGSRAAKGAVRGAAARSGRGVGSRAARGARRGAARGAGLGAARGAVRGSGRSSFLMLGADVLIDGGLIAGSANLLNLFDLRPGRAVKVAALTGAPLALTNGPGAATAAATLGSATALLDEDLGERAMLGDSGANALGALLGLAAVTTLPRAGRIAALAVVAGLTAASEKVSFTKVIAATPPLHKIDMLGRRPVEPRPQADEPAETSGAALTP